jgi:hypothetical protein
MIDINETGLLKVAFKTENVARLDQSNFYGLYLDVLTMEELRRDVRIGRQTLGIAGYGDVPVARVTLHNDKNMNPAPDVPFEHARLKAEKSLKIQRDYDMRESDPRYRRFAHAAFDLIFTNNHLWKKSNGPMTPVVIDVSEGILSDTRTVYVNADAEVFARSQQTLG